MGAPREPLTVRADGTVVVTVHVQPGARHASVGGRHGDALRVRVTAPAEGGRANAAVLAAVADALSVRPGQLELLSGATSRTKRIGVEGVPADEVRLRLSALLGG